MFHILHLPQCPPSAMSRHSSRSPPPALSVRVGGIKKSPMSNSLIFSLIRTVADNISDFDPVTAGIFKSMCTFLEKQLYWVPPSPASIQEILNHTCKDSIATVLGPSVMKENKALPALIRGTASSAQKQFELLTLDTHSLAFAGVLGSALDGITTVLTGRDGPTESSMFSWRNIVTHTIEAMGVLATYLYLNSDIDPKTWVITAVGFYMLCRATMYERRISRLSCLLASFTLVPLTAPVFKTLEDVFLGSGDTPWWSIGSAMFSIFLPISRIISSWSQTAGSGLEALGAIGANMDQRAHTRSKFVYNRFNALLNIAIDGFIKIILDIVHGAPTFLHLRPEVIRHYGELFKKIAPWLTLRTLGGFFATLITRANIPWVSYTELWGYLAAVIPAAELGLMVVFAEIGLHVVASMSEWLADSKVVKGIIAEKIFGFDITGDSEEEVEWKEYECRKTIISILQSFIMGFGRITLVSGWGLLSDAATDPSVLIPSTNYVILPAGAILVATIVQNRLRKRDRWISSMETVKMCIGSATRVCLIGAALGTALCGWDFLFDGLILTEICRQTLTGPFLGGEFREKLTQANRYKTTDRPRPPELVEDLRHPDAFKLNPTIYKKEVQHIRLACHLRTSCYLVNDTTLENLRNYTVQFKAVDAGRVEGVTEKLSAFVRTEKQTAFVRKPSWVWTYDWKDKIVSRTRNFRDPSNTSTLRTSVQCIPTGQVKMPGGFKIRMPGLGFKIREGGWSFPKQNDPTHPLYFGWKMASGMADIATAGINAVATVGAPILKHLDKAPYYLFQKRSYAWLPWMDQTQLVTPALFTASALAIGFICFGKKQDTKCCLCNKAIGPNEMKVRNRMGCLDIWYAAQEENHHFFCNDCYFKLCKMYPPALQATTSTHITGVSTLVTGPWNACTFTKDDQEYVAVKCLECAQINKEYFKNLGHGQQPNDYRCFKKEEDGLTWFSEACYLLKKRLKIKRDTNPSCVMQEHVVPLVCLLLDNDCKVNDVLKTAIDEQQACACSVEERVVSPVRFDVLQPPPVLQPAQPGRDLISRQL